MPTKGSGRRHESIDLHTPGELAASDHDDVDDVNDELPMAGDGWTDVSDTADDAVAEPAAVRSSRRTYRGDLVYVEMENVTAVRAAMRTDQGMVDDVVVTLPDDIQVRLPMRFSSHDFFYGLRRQDIETADGATCSCGRSRCGHQITAQEAVVALVRAERVRSGLAEWEATSNRVRNLWSQQLDDSLRARSQASRAQPDGEDWAEDRTAFQRAYRAAKDAQQTGANPIPYMTEDATGGLGARDGGRAFGVEIEFDVTDPAAIRAIGADLHSAGITTTPSQQGYHSGRGDYSQWRFERDVTVSGEIVSPILYDEPETWQRLQQVCDIVKRHGGTASVRCGGHVHVGVGDYDHTPANHQQLLEMFAGNEDTLYRLAQNPSNRWHRGTMWCRPNRIPSAPYQTSDRYQINHNSHQVALNFGAVGGHQTDHVEFRMWDGSLDPATIQTQIKLSLAMADTAFRDSGSDEPSPEPIGTHRATNQARLQQSQRLRGDAWRQDTAGFRTLMDRLFTRTTDREQATALFAATRWQRRR